MQWCKGGHDRPQEISGELFSLRTSQVLLLPRASGLENLTTCGPASPFAAEPAKELLKALVLPEREDRLTTAGNIKVLGGLHWVHGRQLGGGRFVKH